MSLVKAHRSIYVMSCGKTVKIGTASDPSSRRKLLQTGNSEPIHLELSVTWCDIAMINDSEAVCHRALRRWRRHGEWFWCSLYIAVGCVVDITQHMVGRTITCHTCRAKKLLHKAQEAIRGESDIEDGYEFAGTDPPWPRGAFWWTDIPSPSGVFGFTWIEKELKRSRMVAAREIDYRIS